MTSAHIVDGRKPHSVLLELFTDGGIGTKIARHDAGRAAGARARLPDADLRAQPGRVRARRGHAAVGRRRATSTSTSSPASRSRRSATATRRWSRRSREQAATADARRQPLLHGAAAAPGRAAVEARRSAARCSSRNSGAEANECAIKLARRHRAGGEIVVLENAFHGRTLGALSATPQREKQEPFAPLVPGFVVVPRDDPAALEDAVGHRTAAVFIEPIQGESRHPPDRPGRCCCAAREACDREGALLVYDEIQCGMGRTGTMWGFESGGGPMPDVMTRGEGPGRRAADRRLHHLTALRRHAPAGRPRLDVRRRPGDRRRRERRAGRGRRRRASSPRSRRRASGSRPGCASCRSTTCAAAA